LTKEKDLTAICIIIAEGMGVEILCLLLGDCCKAPFYFQQIKISESIIKLIMDVTSVLPALNH